jgi:hypothetical protein
MTGSFTPQSKPTAIINPARHGLRGNALARLPGSLPNHVTKATRRLVEAGYLLKEQRAGRATVFRFPWRINQLQPQSRRIGVNHLPQSKRIAITNKDFLNKQRNHN